MKEKLLSLIRRDTDFTMPLVLCVSGGKDSICMLHLVSLFSDRFSEPPFVVHFNHGLRPESAEEEQFVTGLSKVMNMRSEVFHFDVEGHAQETGSSIEAAARHLRYTALEKFTAGLGPEGSVFTAHNADDQAETVLFRIIKGTGRKGLSGIRREFRLSSGWLVKRPLLSVPTTDILEYLDSQSVEYRKDKSNMNMDIPRNLIRHRIMDLCRCINPSFHQSVEREVRIWSAEDVYLDSVARNAMPRDAIDRREGRIYINLKYFKGFDEWVRARIMRLCSPLELDYERIKALTGLIRNTGASKRIEIGSGWHARKEYGFLVFEKEVPRIPDFEYDIKPGEDVRIKEAGIFIQSCITDDTKVPSAVDIQVFDADKLDTESLKVRSRRPGDRFKVFGGVTKKVKDILIELKLPLALRGRAAVFTAGSDILWVAPYRRSAVAPVTAKTKKVLRLQVKDE